MDEVGESKVVSQLFTRGRHKNVSVIYLTQNLFHAKQRTISLNADYMIIFKNVRDQRQFKTLAQQLLPNRHVFLMQAYQDATTSPYSYLMLDLKPETDDKYRIRTRILPAEAPQFVYIPTSLTCI